MYHTLCETYPYAIHANYDLSAFKCKMNIVDPSDLTNMRSGLKNGTSEELTTMVPDTTTSEAPVVSSVWLEQGEYFFDDEFAVPFDTNLRDNLEATKSEANNNPNMTRSLGAEVTGHSPLQTDHSRSDSCIFTPGESSESGLASGQTDRTQSPEEGADSTTQRNTKENKFHNQTLSPVIPKPSVPFGLSNAPVPSCMHSAATAPESEAVNGYLRNFDTGTNGCKEKTDMENQNSFSNGILHQSMTGSQISGQSDSTSWMQMLMERSCNPDLKALLNRTAAAVDYKLAYGGDPSDSSSFLRQILRENSENSLRQKPRGLSRSLSQGSLLAAASLVGLRHALEQATQFLPKTKQSNEPAHVRSVGVTAEMNGAGDHSAHTSDSAEVTTSNTTTWAQRHGSRESLKRKALKTNHSNDDKDLTVFPIPSNATTDDVNPWRAMKKASGTLITWNQLKRTIKTGKGLTRAATCRESRLDRYCATAESADPKQHLGSPDASVTTSAPETDTRLSTRSRSQPVPNNHFTHRFSGTLLEIFMRAKAEEMTCLGPSTDTSNMDVGGDVLELRSKGTRLLARAPTECSPVPIITRRSLGSGFDSGRQIAEADKHPLLRGDRILPHKFQPPEFASPGNGADVSFTSVHSFGAQFPPTESSEQVTNSINSGVPVLRRQKQQPIWSAGLPTRRVSAAVRPWNCVGGSHPRVPSVPGRPQSSAGKQYQFTPSGVQFSPCIPASPLACLTASAGPDSPCLAALRADCVADGYSPGWIGNPRASVAYPGLGLLSIPRPSRLTSAAFLSHTLPDLSFLGQAGDEEERKGTPTMPKRFNDCHCRNRSEAKFYCTKCGCRSVSVGRNIARHFPRFGGKFGRQDSSPDNGDALRSGKLTNIPPDLVAGHALSPECSGGIGDQAARHTRAGYQYKNASVDRSSSEPDLKQAAANAGSESDRTGDLSSARPNILMTSSNREWDSRKSSDPGYFDSKCRPKKSVSFSGKIRLLRLQGGDSSSDFEAPSPASPEPKVIPRNWGLYGQETPLAEFNPRNSPGRDTNHADVGQQSDVDVRYHAMVNDVIKAVQETVAYYSTAASPIGGKKTNIVEPLPYTTIAALGSTGRQPLLAVVGPLTVLLCDGLLPPTKPIFITKPRTRLWQMVEESCRPGACPSGVAFHVLSDAVAQVKALTNVTLEKVKFKAFICACLNAKALPMWLNAVVANETLLRRFYCEDAFVRQCRSSQRGLHADLMTHLEQLLAFPFNLDLAVEARKPLIDPHTIAKASSSSSGSMVSGNDSSHHQMEYHASKTPSRSNIPHTGLISHRQPGSATGPLPATRSRLSPPLANANPTAIHHYPQHHLPGQRTNPPRPGTPARPTRSAGQFMHAGDDSAASTSASSDATQNETKLCFKRAAASSGAQSIPLNNTTNSQVRGRFKSALSTFRRPHVSPSKNDHTSSGTRVNSASHGRIPGSSGIPTSDSNSKVSNNRRGVENAASRLKPPPVAEKPKIISKLKQPATMNNRR
ncbi:unnamed protein product [Calicophoron daubneyi]|uniref:RUN domain-containing protein n=1 Tax=Calicophoron daubneyi TaxID=300641 RepID=A0AAV2TVJ0_CALDB